MRQKLKDSEGCHVAGCDLVRPGEVFNPKGMFRGVFVPEWLLQMRVPASAKFVYGRAASLASDQGVAEFDQEWMAEQIGADQATVKRSLTALENEGLIRVERPTGARRLAHRPNRYWFIWHPAMDPSPKRVSAVDEDASPGEGKMRSPEVAERPVPESHSAPPKVVGEKAVGEGLNPLGPAGAGPLPEQDCHELVLLDGKAAEATDVVATLWQSYQDMRAEVLGSRTRGQSLTRTRRELIARRVRERGAEMVADALRGWRHDSHYMGQNPDGKVWGAEGVELVLSVTGRRDNVEKFANLEADAREGTLPSPATLPGAAGATARWAALDAFAQAEDAREQLGAGGAA